MSHCTKLKLSIKDFISKLCTNLFSYQFSVYQMFTKCLISPKQYIKILRRSLLKLQTSHRWLQTSYRRLQTTADEWQKSHTWLQTSNRWLQTSHRRLQTTHKQLQTSPWASHRRLHTNHSKSSFEYFYKTLFSERIWFSKCSYKKVVFT